MIRIGSSGIDSLGNGNVGSVGGASSDGRSSSTAASLKSDSVSLSSAASLVALAKSGAASRQSRLYSIGAEVRSGLYQTDYTQLSQAVVQSHIEG